MTSSVSPRFASAPSPAEHDAVPPASAEMCVYRHPMTVLVPDGADPAAGILITARGLRAAVDGYVAVLLPAYLLALGLDVWSVGVLSTATLLGSAAATIAVGAWGHRVRQRSLLLWAAVLMVGTGAGFAVLSDFWPLLLVAFAGTLNPSSGDVSVFLPLEHARLAGAASGQARVALFARYSLIASLSAAIGALAAAVPAWAAPLLGVEPLLAMRWMFVAYAAVGLAIFALYRRLPEAAVQAEPTKTPLGPSRRVVFKLAALFSVDAFGGGLVVNSLMSLWLMQKFGLSLAAAGAFFFWTGLLAAASQLAAPVVARRIGLLNTMVFTHIPANVCLVLAALASEPVPALTLLFIRSALSQMDVPTRTAYVMSVVTPAERAAAASLTAVPRSLAASLSPSLGGALFAAGWLATPLVLAGALKIGYDITLWMACREHKLEDS